MKVHADLILCRQQMDQFLLVIGQFPPGSAMYMSVELYVMRFQRKAQQREMIQEHLVTPQAFTLLKPSVGEMLVEHDTEVFNLMITVDKADTSVESPDNLRDILVRGKGEIAQMENRMVRSDHTVPVADDGFVLRFHIRKDPQPASDYPFMIEMGIRSEPSLFRVISFQSH